MQEPDDMEPDTPQLETRAELSQAAITCLREDLYQINAIKSELGPALLRYVIEGEGEETLSLLTATDGAALAMNLISSYSWNSQLTPCQARKKLFRERLTDDGGVLYRLGKVYFAAFQSQAARQRAWHPLPDGMGWFELLVRESFAELWCNECGFRLDVRALINALVAADESPGMLARLILNEANPYSIEFEYIDGLGPYFETQTETVLAALNDSNARIRVNALKELHRSQAHLNEAVRSQIIRLAIGSAKTVRGPAENLLSEDSDPSTQTMDELQTALTTGSTGERFHSVGVLVRLYGEVVFPLLQERLPLDKSPKVLNEIRIQLNLPEETTAEPEGSTDTYDDCLTAPPTREFEAEYVVTKKQEADFYATMDDFNESSVRAEQSLQIRRTRRGQDTSVSIKPPISKKIVQQILTSLTTPDACQNQETAIDRSHRISRLALFDEIQFFCEDSQLPLVALIRLAWTTGLIEADRHPPTEQLFWFSSEFKTILRDYVRKRDPKLNLLDIAVAFRAAGLTEKWIEQLYLNGRSYPEWNPLQLTDNAIWPFFHQHPQRLMEVLGLKPCPRGIPEQFQVDLRHCALRILGTFPKPPQPFIPFLWEQVWGSGTEQASVARNCLKNYPNKEKTILRALDDKRQEVRRTAASWLGELKAKSAIPALKKALKKEKQDHTKAVLMTTLEHLGADLDPFLNCNTLQAEARKTLEKPIHRNLEWFPFDQLPTVHWQKSLQEISPEVVKHLILQAFKLKEIAPNPLHRRYIDLISETDRRSLGRFILEAWIHEDTRPTYTYEDAVELANREVQCWKQRAQRPPALYSGVDEETYFKKMLKHFLTDFRGSAISSKGVLAIAAAACGSDCVPMIARYLKEWYGNRPSQCKALVRVLTWIDDPQAIQLLLSVGTRFRTKSIQQEAALCADILAERKEWTRDELADRTIPTAGFEPDGLQTIDYGSRQFTARLSEDLTIELRNAEGKPIKALPNATQSEDEDRVNALKKALSANRKELKQVLKLQRERLYEALCVERQWRFEDWNTYLNAHPILSQYCQRLVWIAKRDEASWEAFRPLPDHTLTDIEDETVTLEPDDIIQIAHQTFLPPETATQWLEHLADYEVPALFQQFGKKLPEPDASQLDRTEIKDCEGHVINSFKLRSRASKLGYTRGPAEDGGWFLTYYKNFPGLKLQAVIEFTGSCLPEESRNVALISLSFSRSSSDGDELNRPIRLNTLPKVLLNECWNDLRRLAEDGQGFDPDWRTATEY